MPFNWVILQQKGVDMEKINEFVFKEMIQETSDIYTFVFDVPKEFNWLPGQHGIWRFKEEKEMEGKDFRIFSFASIPNESKMLISTRIVEEPSDYKKHLLALKPGDIMTVDSAQGKFKINNHDQPILIMAGGIGVTPIRAFVKEVMDQGISPKAMTVFYSDDRGEFAYTDLLKSADHQVKGLDIVFISDRNEFTDKIETYAKDLMNDSLYYLSGTPGMTKFLTGKLKDLGIEAASIKTDTFAGYK